MSLSADDLAYMRATAAESRPTTATYQRRVSTRTASGGTTQTYQAGEPIQVRIDGTPDDVPTVVGDRLQGGTAVKIHLDLLRDVRDGDRIVIDAAEAYEVVTDGDPDRWATAQAVWARRYLFPVRA